jgi:hypothetical protein
MMAYHITDKMIIAALGGVPIMGLVENWSFRIEEVSPYVFKAYGDSINLEIVVGYGGEAKAALMNCIHKVERIDLRDQRRRKLEKTLSKIKK